MNVNVLKVNIAVEYRYPKYHLIFLKIQQKPTIQQHYLYQITINMICIKVSSQNY